MDVKEIWCEILNGFNWLYYPKCGQFIDKLSNYHTSKEGLYSIELNNRKLNRLAPLKFLFRCYSTPKFSFLLPYTMSGFRTFDSSV